MGAEEKECLQCDPAPRGKLTSALIHSLPRAPGAPGHTQQLFATWILPFFFPFQSKVPQTNFVLRSPNSEQWDFKVTRALREGPARALTVTPGSRSPALPEFGCPRQSRQSPLGWKTWKLSHAPTRFLPVTAGLRGSRDLQRLFAIRKKTKGCLYLPGGWRAVWG